MGTLRLLLAISVFSAHTKPLFGLTLVGGSMAVQTFYMISGFYMALILTEKYHGKHRYRLFLENRFLRLYPTYALIALITFVCMFAYNVVPAHVWFPYGSNIPLLTKIWLILGQIPLIGQDIFLYFQIDPITGGLSFVHNLSDAKISAYEFTLVHGAWTIGVEMWFYLLAPFLTKARLRTLLLLILLSLSVRLMIYMGIGWWYKPWTYCFFPNELVFFLTGILGYRFYRVLRKNPHMRQWGFAVWLLVIGVTCLLHAPVYPTIPQMMIYMPLVAISLPFIFLVTQSWKADKLIGELSYPLYLSHILFIELNNHVWHTLTHVQILGISLVFSAAVMFFLERPINLWRQARVYRTQEISAF